MTKTTASALHALLGRVPARLAWRYWAGSVLESSAGHYVTGVAHGVFGASLPAPGRDAMTVRAERRAVEVEHRALAAAFPDATGSVVVFLHGLVETERGWFRGATPGADFGTRLAADVGSTPVYLRYNSGRHVWENGRELVALLSRLVAAWPVPVTDIVLIGHSMGGLVARSALYQAQEQGSPWLPRVTRLVCLGTPHRGAPLERHVARLVGVLGRSAAAAPLARVLALRSDGIQDLAYGHVHHAQAEAGATWRPEPGSGAGIRRLFVSATLSRTQDSTWGRLFGDLLVTPVGSDDLTEDADVVWLGGLNHFALLHENVVYEALLGWLR
ncbi:GPI inositol-deacylase [Amycolatopsis sp. NBC_00348]|uniref:esterase/lipase family protein n=1 Tax=Amycolatopsis sp. NBC_00348 TaxID=2975956 RepID=UPI002E26D2B0